MNFILERAKAFAAIFASAALPAIIHAASTAFTSTAGFSLPAGWETAITVALVGLVVHQVPNKTA